MGSLTRPRGLPRLVMISLPPVFVQILWSLFSTCSFIVLWLLVFFLGYSPLCFLLLLCAPRCCFVMLYLVSPRMSCWWFLRFFVTYLMFLSSIFGWLAMIFVFGGSVLRLWVLSLVFGFIFLCSSVASVLLVVVVFSFANGVLVVSWLPFGMMFLLSTFSLSLSCVFVVCPGLSWAYHCDGWVGWLAVFWFAIRPCAGSCLSCCPVVLCVICLFRSSFYVGVGFDSPASLACWYTPVWDGTVFDGVVGMSGGHCTHPTGGPAIRLKHKKTSYCRLFVISIFVFFNMIKWV